MTLRFQTEHFGSTQHYYHFLLGLVVPLILWRAEHDTPLVVPSQGPLDRIILELDMPDVRIGDDADETVTVRGYDRPEWFDAAAFREVSWRTRARLGPLWWRSGTLLISRNDPEPFYLNDADVPGAGAWRRSIPNGMELRAALAPFVFIGLEQSSLRDQVALFSSATTVVAQHGAALANMIWMQRPCRVVEIIPRHMFDLPPARVPRATIFQRLAACLGIEHAFVMQEGDHGPVDVEAVKNAVLDLRP